MLIALWMRQLLPLKEENFDAASDGPADMAFVRLERKYREVLEKNLAESDNNNSYETYVIEYINHTIETAKALGLDFLDLCLSEIKLARTDDEVRREMA